MRFDNEILYTETPTRVKRKFQITNTYKISNNKRSCLEHWIEENDPNDIAFSAIFNRFEWNLKSFTGIGTVIEYDLAAALLQHEREFPISSHGLEYRILPFSGNNEQKKSAPAGTRHFSGKRP